MLSREEFLKDTDLKRETVEIEGLGSVLMRELSVGERLDWRAKWMEREGDDDERDTTLSLALIAVGLCQPDGSPMFAEGDIEGAVGALKRKSTRTIDALQTAFLAMSGVDEEAVKNAVGNSIEIPSVPSSTGSRGISATPTSEASPAA